MALIAVIVMMTACGGTTTIDKDGTTTTTTTTTDGETVTTTVSGTEGADSWCPEGGDWNVKVEGVEGAGEASWKIDKLITSGEYEGLCHVIYTATGPQGDVKMDYYFSEDGKSGYYEMEVNGQKISQEWSSD